MGAGQADVAAMSVALSFLVTGPPGSAIRLAADGGLARSPIASEPKSIGPDLGGADSAFLACG